MFGFEEEMEMDTVLIRLINNDRIIGQIISADKDVIAIYAPMLIETQIVEDRVDYAMSPYDPLSSTMMAIMSHDLIMTVTVPKPKVIENYNESWPSFYPNIADVRKKMKEKAAQENGEEFLDPEKVSEMFKSILSNSVSINKKKLH